MKILLLNDNPVVNKLVTLSAQKTSDSLEVATTLDEININSCDLLVVDDTLYSDEVMQELKNKVQFDKSLYICSKDSEIVDGFTSILRKPFLPTDLVEMFLQLSKEANSIDSNEVIQDNSEILQDDLEELNLDDVTEEIDNLDDFNLDVDSLNELNENTDIDELEVDLDSSIESSQGTEVDELEEFSSQESEELNLKELEENELLLDEDNLENMDDLNFDEELSLNETLDSVLDKDDLQEVQDLLNETEVNSDNSIEFSKDTEIDELEEFSNQELEELENEELNFDELEVNEEELNIDEKNDKVENLEEINSNSSTESNEDTEIDELEEFSSQELNLDEIEEQIESAEEELSKEDLESELNLDDFDSLTTNALKLAIGEPITGDNLSESAESTEVNELEEFSLESEPKSTLNNDGIEKLKKLLEALTNEEVAASMKGMKININIELGS